MEKSITQIIDSDKKLHDLFMTDPLVNKSIKYFENLPVENILIETIKVLAAENERLNDILIYDLQTGTKMSFYTSILQ